VPTYEYRCSNGHTFEVFQSMSDDPVTACQECGAPVERVFHPVAVHFKGSGFYTTDYARKGSAKESSDDGSKAESKEAKKPDTNKKQAEGSSKKQAEGSSKNQAESSSKPD
jgi:putative FmdB family regulatory protein